MLTNTKEKLKFANFRLAPFLLFGITAGIFIVNCKTVAASIILIAVIAVIFTLALFITDTKRGIVMLFAAVVVLGGLSATLTHYSYTKNLGESINNTYIAARVKGINYDFAEGEYTGKAKTIMIEDLIVDGKKYSGEGYLNNVNSDIIFSIGNKINITGNIQVLDTDTKNSYSMKLFNDKIFYEITADDIQLEGTSNIKLAEKIRAGIFNSFNANMDSRVAGFCYSMLFGDKTYLYPYDKVNFQLVGTAHIFAVSGLHVGVFTGVLLFVLKLIKTKAKTNLIIVAIVLSVYAWLASFSPSVIRAGTMAIIALLAKALGRRNDILSTVTLTAALLLLFKPYWIYDISFLLSFTAVFGIVLMYKPVYKKFKKIKYFGDAASLNLAVNIGILPFTLLFFGYFSLLTLPINLVIIPIVSVVYILSILHLFISGFLPFMVIFGKAAELLAAFCLDLTAWTASLSWAVINISLSLIAFVPYYAAVFSISDYSLIKKGNKLIVFLLAGIFYGLLFLFGMPQ